MHGIIQSPPLTPLPVHHCRVPLLSNSSTQNLCSEEAALRALNDLLINTAWRMVHDYRAFLVINLGVYPRVSNQVDDPLLTLILVQTKAGREIAGESQ